MQPVISRQQRKLLRDDPSEVDFRRSTSTAYYALFHHLCWHFSAVVQQPHSGTLFVLGYKRIAILIMVRRNRGALKRNDQTGGFLLVFRNLPILSLISNKEEQRRTMIRGARIMIHLMLLRLHLH
jgi:hypothetical protein